MADLPQIMDGHLARIRGTGCRVKLYVTGELFDLVVQFYQTQLRLTEIHRWVIVKDRGVMFELGQSIVLELHDSPRHRGAVSGSGLSVAVENVWQLHRALTDLGVPVQPIRDNDWGDTSFAVVDPSGFEIDFFTQTRELGASIIRNRS